MSDNLPVSKDTPIMGELEVVQFQPKQDRRVLPAYAYVQTGLGELSLLARLDDTIRMLADVLRPLVVNFEAQQPQPLICVICGPGRNFAGWPQPVLVDHWFQHSPIQRRLAAMGLR